MAGEGLAQIVRARELGCVTAVRAFARGGNVVWRRRSSCVVIVTTVALTAIGWRLRG